MLTKNTLSLAVVLALLSSLAGATQSQETLPVVGQGAPQAPTSVTLNQPLKVGQTSTATAAGYSDPDSDPLANWEYEWRSAAAGAGNLLATGPSYAPANTTPVYLRSRALAARGYPEVQKVGAWAEQKLTPLASGIGTKCAGGSTLNSGGLTWTCPLTQSDADEIGIVYSSITNENGENWVVMNWLTARDYCQNQGYRQPTEYELSALHTAKGNMFMAAGWPVGNRYWSSTLYSANYHQRVSLSDGSVIYGNDSTNTAYATCVR